MTSPPPIDPISWTCPMPLRDYPRITLAHGGGGQLTADLISELFLPAFGDAAAPADLADAALLSPDFALGGRLAFTTDAHVVTPLAFPGGDIGSLAVNGTVNDLAMVGAKPLALSTAFVLEEGLELETLHHIASSMGRAASHAHVQLVTGDTKVVEQGHGDGVYITTAGVGVVPAGVELGAHQIGAGDAIIVSAPIGRHGVAVLSQRDGLEFGTTITSDCASLAAVVGDLMIAECQVHAMRDLTRGGLLAGLCELAAASATGFTVELSAVPIPQAVRAACGFLGLDPLGVANEGTFVAVVAADAVESALAVMRQHPDVCEPAVIGTVVDEHQGNVVGRTALGGTRVLVRPLGEQLPRIC